ncbi:Predicted neuraminidase (sialidase) [Devosia lucknowensis]|uniref:Predicted neuraminidase (Sialidase) n=1 Tax=Devosia lucknowensis TaxID=1096929 RepID=A0A1Y6F9R0_9HYPH|nr:exo-alpha-sialidase [Devosia lucknowensis]SMQ69123.1 Predicted neuraminidase (sialidase) [Devosia lucknowensis]
MSPDEIAARMDGQLVQGVEGRSEAFLPSPMVQNHAAFIERLDDGTLACLWFGGSLEGKSDISIHASTLAPGATRWSEAVQLSDDPDRSEQNPVLWRNGRGEWQLFHTAQPSGNQDECLLRARPVSLENGALSGGRPREIDLPLGSFIRGRFIRRADGAWMMPVFRCISRPGQRWNGSHDTAAVAVSHDEGATWTMSEVPGSIGSVHMTIVPTDGDHMVAFYRRRQSDFVHRSESRDGGVTWSEPAPTDVPNNNSSINVIRLADGRLAMLCNPTSSATSADRRTSLYDEIEEGDDRPDASGGCAPIWGVPRAPMTLCISTDGGLTWPLRRVVDDSPGTCLSNNSVDGRNKELSYPYLLEGEGGELHLAYTYFRRAIKYVRLPAGWIDGDKA